MQLLCRVMQRMCKMSDLRLNARMKTSVVSVLSTATALPTTPLNSQTSRTLYNDGSETIYLGAQNVTATGATKGIPLKAGAEKTFGCSEKFLLYGTAATGPVSIIVGEAY